MDIENRFAYNMETETVSTAIISRVAEITGCELYLELGIMEGVNMREVCKYSKRNIGVDINDCLFEDFEFHKKTTDEFFKTFEEHPNIIFIDADHHFEQVKNDFINSLNCLSEHGIIFLHDTDPYQQELLDQGRCGDSYKMHDWIRFNYPELCIITLPVSIAGITMVNRDKDRRVLKYLNDI
jgi:hypothetical protein